MAHGIVTPLPRIIGPTEAAISGYMVPAGVRAFASFLLNLMIDGVLQTVVSMGATFLHNNPHIFPDPSTFKPERWLREDSTMLEKYLVSFSKGPRSCLGIK